MIPSRKRLLWAGMLASAALASAGAFAQATQTPGATPPPPAAEASPVPQAGPQGPRMRGHHAERFEHMEQMRARHLASLKEKLKLEPSQEGAWNTFAAAQEPPARAAGQPPFDRAEFAKLTTPQRLDRMQALQAERTAMFAKRADATRSFYSTLSPAQQKTFDAESMPRFGGGEHRGPRRAPPPPPPAKN